jgi:hypothetical protein
VPKERRVSKYGRVALRAAEILKRGWDTSPRDAWRLAAAEVFPAKVPSQKKACPKGAFLGLVEDGLVVDVPAQPCGAGVDNKAYAVEAVRLLVRSPSLAEAGPGELWLRVMNGRDKRPNSQMDVVLALWERGLIAR